VISSVNKISHKNVVCFCQVASGSEELKKIEELTVNITANGDGAAHGLDIRLLQKILLHLHTLRYKSADIHISHQNNTTHQIAELL